MTFNSEVGCGTPLLGLVGEAANAMQGMKTRGMNKSFIKVVVK
jgi:hypothetical protein